MFSIASNVAREIIGFAAGRRHDWQAESESGGAESRKKGATGPFEPDAR